MDSHRTDRTHPHARDRLIDDVDQTGGRRWIHTVQIALILTLGIASLTMGCGGSDNADSDNAYSLMGGCAPPDNCGVDKCGTECDSRLCQLKAGLAGVSSSNAPTHEKEAEYRKQCGAAIEFMRARKCGGAEGAAKVECKKYGIDM